MTTPLRRPAFLASLMVLLDLHGREMEVDTQEAFFQTVAALPGDLVLAAMRELQTEPWMPKPADVIALVKVKDREQRRALKAAEAAKALPQGQASEAERTAMLQGMRDLVGQLSSQMSHPSPAGRHTPASAQAEVASLRSREQADPSFLQRRQAAVAAFRRQGALGGSPPTPSSAP